MKSDLEEARKQARASIEFKQFVPITRKEIFGAMLGTAIVCSMIGFGVGRPFVAEALEFWRWLIDEQGTRHESRLGWLLEANTKSSTPNQLQSQRGGCRCRVIGTRTERIECQFPNVHGTHIQFRAQKT